LEESREWVRRVSNPPVQGTVGMIFWALVPVSFGARLLLLVVINRSR
jgi:hypothetical protein